MLEQRKATHHIDVLEPLIPPMKLGSVNAYLTFMSSPALDALDPAVTNVREKLEGFYFSKWFAKSRGI